VPEALFAPRTPAHTAPGAANPSMPPPNVRDLLKSLSADRSPVGLPPLALLCKLAAVLAPEVPTGSGLFFLFPEHPSTNEKHKAPSATRLTASCPWNPRPLTASRGQPGRFRPARVAFKAATGPSEPTKLKVNFHLCPSANPPWPGYNAAGHPLRPTNGAHGGGFVVTRVPKTAVSITFRPNWPGDT